MKHEKGFVYPLVLMLCTLLMFAFFYQLDRYLLEKRFVQEQGYMQLMDAYMQIAIQDFLVEIDSPKEHKEYLFNYDKGSVKLTVGKKEEQLWPLYGHVQLKDIQRQKFASIYYHEEMHMIHEYWEVSKRD